MDGVRRLVLTKPLAIGSASMLKDMDKWAKDFIMSSVQCIIATAGGSSSHSGCSLAEQSCYEE
eukprot:scaffold12796_cov67-Skeletonema_dohrnii-CCMP3373.AAC.4